VTDTGINLLDPGKTPGSNVRFLVFLLAIIAAVDDHADLLRLSVATAGNDHRLGGNEAPPAIISIFVGDELAQVLEDIEAGRSGRRSKRTMMGVGAEVIPSFAKDTTDRNRTSPFAFTGNKFEFRMPGSSVSVSQPNIVLNTVVAEALEQFYEKLKDVPQEKMEAEVEKLLKSTLKKHKRILFNGNGYTDEWVEEAAKRGLYNLKSLPDCMPMFASEENIDLFVRHGVFTREEVVSRTEILLENYSKTIHIESLTMQDMVRKDFTPALLQYMDKLTGVILAKRQILEGAPCSYEKGILQQLDAAAEQIQVSLAKLDADTKQAEQVAEAEAAARYYQSVILVDMDELRAAVDSAEALIPDSILPYPTYEELMFSLR